MKTALQHFAKGVIMAAMLFALGCEADKTDFRTPSNTIDPNTGVNTDKGTGSLALDGIAVSINTDMEQMRSALTNEASDSYIIYIVDEATEEVYKELSYAEAKALTAPISIAVGNYYLYATSTKEVAATAWESPEYRSINYPFSIGADKTTQFTEAVVCKLSNIRVHVEISADLKDLFKADADIDQSNPDDWKLETLLSMGEKQMSFVRDETRSGFFAVQDGITTLDVNMRGMYNSAPSGEEPSYIQKEWKKSITGVTMGQARDIEIKIEHYNEGVLDITFVITSWVYDEELNVTMSSQLIYASNEQVIYDPDDDKSDPYSPAVVLDGAEGAEYYIFPAMFDTTLSTYSPALAATITPEAGSAVKSIDFVLSSDNEEFADKIAEAGIGAIENLYSDGVINETYNNMLTLTKDDATGIFAAELTYEGAKTLEAYRGTHSVKLIVEDDAARRSVTKLNLNSVASDKLEIIWTNDGYSFDEDHYIMGEKDENYVALPVEFAVTSKSGLTKLSIDIVSDVLSPEELDQFNLSQSMDLINPATNAMEENLLDLGFPVRDEVEGKTELYFNISKFMPILANLSAAGSGDKTVFTIKAGDDSNAEECVVNLTLIRK